MSMTNHKSFLHSALTHVQRGYLVISLCQRDHHNERLIPDPVTCTASIIREQKGPGMKSFLRWSPASARRLHIFSQCTPTCPRGL